MRGSREFDMMGRLHADMFFQDRYMLNKVGVKIKLNRSKDAFCLMGASKVQIVNASMFVRKVKLTPSVFLAHAKTLPFAELQSIPYDAWYASRSRSRRITWMSVTRNYFLASYLLASS